MIRPALAILLALAFLTSGCGRSAGPRTTAEPPGVTVEASSVNPDVTAPPAQVKVAEGLPAVTAPQGFITQEAARDLAVAAMQNRQWGGLFLLDSLRFDEANKMWEAEFQAEAGRIADRPRGHPPGNLPVDPVQQRKLERSWVTVVSHIRIFLDGVTGEVRGGGYRGGNVEPDRPDLEHYRGVIMDGGEVLRLRLAGPDGSPVGREIEVWVPQDSMAEGLALWQLQYGLGRTVEVWGLTAAPGVVTAHRIVMPEPPPESVLSMPRP